MQFSPGNVGFSLGEAGLEVTASFLGGSACPAVGLSEPQSLSSEDAPGFLHSPVGRGSSRGCSVPLKEQGELSQGLVRLGVLQVRAGTTQQSLEGFTGAIPRGLNLCSSASCLLCLALTWMFGKGRHRQGSLPAPVARLPSVPARKATMGLG